MTPSCSATRPGPTGSSASASRCTTSRRARVGRARPRRPVRPSDPRLRPQLAPARRVRWPASWPPAWWEACWCWPGLARPRPRLAACADATSPLPAWVVARAPAAACRMAGVSGRPGRRRRRHDLRTPAGPAPGSRAGDASGEAAALITRGVAAAEPYLTRYVPALVLAAVLPPLAVIAVASPGPAERRHRAGHASPGPRLRCTRGAGHPRQGRPAVAGPGRALGPFPRRDARAAHPGRPPPRPRPVGADRATITDRYRRGLDAHAAHRVRLLGRARAGRHLVGRARRRHGGRPAGRRFARTCTPLWSCCCWPRRPTGRCAGSAPSSTPRPRAWPRSRPPRACSPARQPRPCPAGPAAPGADLVVAGLTVTYGGRTVPALAPLDVVLPRPRRHRRDRSVGLRQVDAPRRRSPGCSLSMPAVSSRRRTPGRWAGVAGPGRLAAPAAGASSHGTVRRQPPARPPPSADDELLWDALRRVALEERVRALPDGLATALGEDGSHAVGRRARAARSGPRRPGGAAPRAARRADRPPRRPRRADHRRHRRGARAGPPLGGRRRAPTRAGRPRRRGGGPGPHHPRSRRSR